MDYGICNLTAIPMRAECSHKSEMVSQLLFGECYVVLGESGGWVKIRTADCNYEGWIQDKQVHRISLSDYEDNQNAAKYRVVEPFVQNLLDGCPVLTMGAFVPGPAKCAANPSLASSDGLSGLSQEEKRMFVVESARKLIGTPYLWGGRTPTGIDCSGLTQVVFSLVGVQLSRDASQQVLEGTHLDFAGEAEPGDLAFFSNECGDIVHVGILLGNSEIIHSSGKVRVDTFDETGIFNRETGKYTHTLRVIKRVL